MARSPASQFRICVLGASPVPPLRSLDVTSVVFDSLGASMVAWYGLSNYHHVAFTTVVVALVACKTASFAGQVCYILSTSFL